MQYVMKISQKTTHFKSNSLMIYVTTTLPGFLYGLIAYDVIEFPYKHSHFNSSLQNGVPIIISTPFFKVVLK